MGRYSEKKKFNSDILEHKSDLQYPPNMQHAVSDLGK